MSLNEGRTIANEELKLLSAMNNAQRLKYIRLELNKLFPKEFSKKRVVENSEVLSYQGLHYLEEKQPEPTMNTLKGLANFYGVPVEVFSDDYYANNPVPFFIGKSMVEISDTTFHHPDYELTIDINVRREGKELIDFQDFSVPETIHLKLSYPELYGLVKLIEYQTHIINDKISMGKRAQLALQQLARKE
ncbi:hypothetical protein [Lederbergia panacisoli]|uniref:hypothetical protein n=1 Tax=Lederbergia panacisoli TaxID=1255251 RepID=UPI00214C6936|nr:hypothetical protein [Lederbergia panacisoli]MCR2820578.1 hypothetical protein [Lederbergia panacisoli]